MSKSKTPRSRSAAPPAGNALFVAMLPTIRSYANFAFRRMRAEAREEAIQEVVCRSLITFARLVDRNLTNLAYASVLATFAIRQYRAGRRVGCSANVKDAMCPRAQRRNGFEVEPLERWDLQAQEWWSAMFVDRRARPDEVAAIRIDFQQWLRLLPSRTRKVVLELARGDRATEIARRYGISDGRISQLRRSLKRHWDEFHGEELSNEQVAACA